MVIATGSVLMQNDRMLTDPPGSPRSFAEAFHRADVLLTEGAVIMRLKSEFGVAVHPDIVPGLLYDGDPKGREALATIYRQYLAIANSSRLPIMIMTPTRRVSRDRLHASPYRGKNVIPDSVAFLAEMRAGFPEHASNIFIGGLMGCAGDAYDPRNALSAADALGFHRWKAGQFQAARVDYLFAGIMPAMPEALGLARAASETGLPYIISFMIRRTGTLLDWTTIPEAIAAIDDGADPKPLCYAVNCVHPLVLREALSPPANRTSLVAERLKGIQANASPQAPEELDRKAEMVSEDPERLAEAMIGLRVDHGLKIFGGCCGTDERHIEALARKLKPPPD